MQELVIPHHPPVSCPVVLPAVTCIPAHTASVSLYCPVLPAVTCPGWLLCLDSTDFEKQ
jgi:hypothetical protein